MITLRQQAEKWHVVPISRLERMSTRTLIGMTDDALLNCWERARADTCDGVRGLGLRGWYHRLYGPWAAGKKILEIGPGIGIDAAVFASFGASISFADISATNLDVIRRVFALKGLSASVWLHVQDFTDFDRLDCDYDAVFAFGSLHHIDSASGQPEFAALARRLKPGGRFVMHAYPYRRWVNEGRMPFATWGETTDGPGTPWAEWYDTEKLIGQLHPIKFAPILYCEYRDGAMNCIDLVKIDGDPDLSAADVPAAARLVRGGVRLREMTCDRSWDASIMPGDDGSIRVTTSPQVWGYAASLTIHREDVPPVTGRWFVKIEATVVVGRIGVSVATADGTSILTEEYLDAHGADRSRVLAVDRDGAALVIIRNASPVAVRSIAVIHSIELFSL